jgi:hypothetical protein
MDHTSKTKRKLLDCFPGMCREGRKKNIFTYFLFYMYLSPHHGRSLADSFGGEFRKMIDSSLLKDDIVDYSGLLDTIRTSFGCQNSIPGSTRVTALKYVVLFINVVRIMLVMTERRPSEK